MHKVIISEKNIGRSVEAISIVKKTFSKTDLEYLDKTQKHYFYIKSPDVSDLIVVEYNSYRQVFDFRECTHEEWVQYFNNNIK